MLNKKKKKKFFHRVPLCINKNRYLYLIIGFGLFAIIFFNVPIFYNKIVSAYDAGNDVEDVLLTVDHQSMAGIVASLETHDKVGITGEQINDFPLTLVTPLGADHYHAGHVFSTIE